VVFFLAKFRQMVKKKVQIGKNLVFYDFWVIKFRFLFLFWKIARFYPKFTFIFF
jgi:hypothetical protein